MPIDASTANFQIDIYKKLLTTLDSKAFNKETTLNNIEYKQLKNIKKFEKEKPFMILQCDKNVGSAIIEIDNYNEIINEHLNDTNYYELIDSNPLNNIIKNINDTIESLYLNNHISKRLFDSFKIINPCLGKFRGLPKIHKNKFSIRPIINYQGQPTETLCFFIDCILQPFVIEMDSYIKDSTSILQLCDKMILKDDSYLISADFESLYSNINHSDAIKIITKYINKVNYKDFNTTAFIEILKLVLNNNFFTFGDKIFKQINGIAMGIKCGPSIANLVVNDYEKKWLLEYNPALYKRYIDDIFIITNDLLSIETLRSSFNYLKLTVEIGNEVNFLDLNISINKLLKKINFKLYFKPTNTFSYLSHSSNHPIYIKKNIPKSLFIRIRRICSFISDYFYFSYITAFQLIRRGYNYINIFKTLNCISKLDRNEIIKYKIRNNNNFMNSNFKKTFFIKYYFDNNYNFIKRILNQSYIDNFSSFSFYKDTKLFAINILFPNLGTIFCHNFKSPNFKKFYCKKCNTVNCITCKFINNNNSNISLKPYFNNGLPILSDSNCNSTNVVYFIFCKLCFSFYIGHTSKTIKTRIKQHLYNIKYCVPFIDSKSCVGLHFNLKNHNYLKHFSFYIFNINLDKFERLNYETFFINLFIKCKINLINDFIPNLYNRKNIELI
jgi:hypothetical protein